MNIYSHAEEFNNGSRFKFAVAVAWPRGLLLFGEGDIILYHFIHLNAELLVDLPADDLGVDEQSRKEADGHE